MDNNPLRQYFRRPAVYIKLPSNGVGYPEGALDMPETGDLPVYPMTAIDEISARTPDALFNGTTVTDLVRSCIPCIKEPWAMLNCDVDAILIAIKAASSGEHLEVDSTCPNCGESGIYKINLIAILSSLKSGDYDTPLEMGELKIKLKPIEYRVMNQSALKQFEIQRSFVMLESLPTEEERSEAAKKALETVTLLTMDIVAKSIEYIETPAMRVEEPEFVLDFLKNCDKNVFAQIRDYNGKLKEPSNIKPLKIKCDSCSHEYEQTFTLNPTDFFD